LRDTFEGYLATTGTEVRQCRLPVAVRVCPLPDASGIDSAALSSNFHQAARAAASVIAAPHLPGLEFVLNWSGHARIFDCKAPGNRLATADGEGGHPNVNDIKLSVAIPYKQRLDNLRLVFEALANQTMDSDEFEVVVGAMEYCDQYVAACREFTDRINIVSVLSAAPFDIPRARNLAMRQAKGRVVVQMDADTLLPANALRNLWDRHFAFGQKVCVVGQVVGYGNNNDGDVDEVELLPHQAYVPVLDELTATVDNPRDPRFQVDHVIPWAFAWTGLIALPMVTVRTHQLYFDENFHGWGVDDLEWGYRICASGTPIILCRDVYALHLPHVRNQAANRRTEQANYRRFLRKWPRVDVELAYAFGDMEANSLYSDFMAQLRTACGCARATLGTVRGPVGAQDVLVVGALINPQHRLLDPKLDARFDDRSRVEVNPLVGLALPYPDHSVDRCEVLPSVSSFSALYRDAIDAEVQRVSRESPDGS